MMWIEATLTAIHLENDVYTAEIACPAHAIPRAGQYLLANSPADGDAPLAQTLFPVAIGAGGFRAFLPYLQPSSPFWDRVGEIVLLRGPLGHGFTPPANLEHLLLAAAGDTMQRLAPLIADAPNADIVLCTDLAATALPSSIEIYPLRSLPEILPWADFLALDVPLDELPQLRSRLGFELQAQLELRSQLPCPAQALVRTPMPCGGVAECGACAVPTRRGYKLACKDGPVFDLRELTW